MIEKRLRRSTVNGESNQLLQEDKPVHNWYRFVLSYPPHLVRSYINKFGITANHQVLDPFCGTGTTVVECKKLGIPSIGVEASLMAHFAGQVKTDWTPDSAGLAEHARLVSQAALAELEAQGIEDNPLFLMSTPASNRHQSLRTLSPEQEAIILANSISPLPLHKVLVLLGHIEQLRDDRYYRHELLALAKTVVSYSSNLHFGPEVGVGTIKADAPVIDPWLQLVNTMVSDLESVKHHRNIPAVVHHADARQINQVLEPNSIDAVITSPPYPNEKDYTRTTRLESVLLGFLQNKAELRALKHGLMRSNTRNVYKGDNDDKWIEAHPEIQQLAERIEKRRIELGKTSGFERLYGKVTKLYFGGMARHLADLSIALRPGAHLAYVVGDQASYLQIMIRTGQLLADVAKELGYEVVSIDLFRTRLATATREQLREEVVVLRWPG